MPSLANKTTVVVTALVFVCMLAHQTAFAQVPTPAHVIVVIEENHGYSQIIGSFQAPYINTLASQGALFTNSYAVTHPSQPNYLALFAGYSEGLPSVGSEICAYGEYVRKHAPWTDFSKDISKDDQPFTNFPTDFTKLPTVSWVIPNLMDDMHDGTIQQADAWLQNHLLAYVTWAATHDSLLIVQWDEDQGTTTNHIATIFVGSMVKPGKYSEKINHYNVLRTIEDMYRLPHLGNSASATPITNVWK